MQCFPTIPLLFNIPTFGFFVAVAFVLSYIIFLSEFKRKERLGVIKTFYETKKSNTESAISDFFTYGLFGFLVGFKVIGAVIDSNNFAQSPLGFIFSFNGSWIAGLLSLLLFLFLCYRNRKIENRTNSTEENLLLHPYELMPKLILWAAVWGFMGAKIFAVLENIDRYKNYSFIQLWEYSGLAFLGGFIFGAISYLIIGFNRGMKLIDLADIGSPGMLVAYGVGRIGCQLAGDGDWGVVNTSPKPFSWLPDWMWSFNFPHNILNEGVYIKGCTQDYCFVLPKGVFPTSLYESFIILTIFLILWFFRNKIRIRGLMFMLFLLTMGIERFLIEEIRLNNRYQFLGFNVSEAQIISACFAVAGGAGLLYILLCRRRLKY